MTVYIIAAVVCSGLLLFVRWIGIATGEERAATRMRVGRARIAHQTIEAQKRRWLQNGEMLEMFERAFSDHTGGCQRQCDCKIQYYNPDNGWDFDKGELELYQADPLAVALAWSVGSIYFEGRYYVPDCDCWKPRALKIIAFLNGHDRTDRQSSCRSRKCVSSSWRSTRRQSHDDNDHDDVAG
jgi:hypothetical protein